MNRPPRPFLTEEQMLAMSDEERAVAIAEWSSYNARLRREQEQQAARGAYRGGRGRGRGRGYSSFSSYQPYSRVPYGRGQFSTHSTTFPTPASPGKPSFARANPSGTANNGVDNSTRSLGAQQEKYKKLCTTFTSTGVCSRPGCRYVHDPDKTAICRQYLAKGTCSLGQACPLSHEPSPNRSPSCIHFQNSHCTKDDCRYAHVRIAVDAPVCEAFGRIGYCEKGNTCADRHAVECPDFTNKGSCDTVNCRLPHIVHAGRLRKARMSSSEVESPADPGTPKSDAESDVDTTSTDPNPHALTQQADYVPFES